MVILFPTTIGGGTAIFMDNAVIGGLPPTHSHIPARTESIGRHNST